MISRVNRACGCDVHKATIAATILSADSSMESRQFSTHVTGLLNLRTWIEDHNVERVLMESTGIYWIPVHAILEGIAEVHLVNPLLIKYLPGRKTDLQDSAWLAEIALNGLYKPSYIPPQPIRELRDLTRTHRKLVEERTRHKNRIHKLLVKNGIRIAGVLSSIFGPSGIKFIEGLTQGKEIPEILQSLKNRRIQKKSAELERAICGRLSENDMYIIQQSLAAIRFLNGQVTEYAARIHGELQHYQSDLAILMSIPGIGFTIGAVLIAEIGDINQFSNPKQLVSWAGLAPAVYESAGKTRYGHITKRGSKHLRTALIEAAHVIARGGPKHLKEFFQRIRRKKGYKIAIVALARKLLTIIHHLLTHQEFFESEEKPKGKSRLPRSMPVQQYDVQQMIEILINAGYTVGNLKEPG